MGWEWGVIRDYYQKIDTIRSMVVHFDTSRSLYVLKEDVMLCIAFAIFPQLEKLIVIFNKL